MGDKTDTQSIHIADISCKAQWKDVPTLYGSVTALFIGKVKIASYSIDGMTYKGDSRKYAVKSSLPSIKGDLGRFETEAECRDMCMKAARTFCQQLSQ